VLQEDFGQRFGRPGDSRTMTATDSKDLAHGSTSFDGLL